ncbi:MAG: LacI family DNA-binding transcriptional regulator [Alphaproteobacteria bacterium]|nr:LacI family DNA-binding transcriptional regulator [Alphaproteobacteria bacterium]
MAPLCHSPPSSPEQKREGVSDVKSRGSIRPTSFDIAYRAGVSQSTVSRALRGDPNVSEDTRRRIESIARQLNYKVDKNASNLRCQHSRTLALLFFEDPTTDDSLINPFFLSMLGSITRACAHRGYDLLISFQQFSHDWRVDYEDSGKADGVILLGYGDYLTYRERLEQLVQQGMHFVCWGAVQQGQPGLSVGCDNHQGGYDATSHLVRLGRRNIAFIGDASSHSPEFSERYRGYAEALVAAGLSAAPELQVDAISTERSGFEATHELIARRTPFDGLMAASDLIAIGAIRALQDQGLHVPADVSVVGFDDIPAASLVNPPLTTVMQDTWQAGEVLVRTLSQLVQGEPAESTVLPARLVVRGSCGARLQNP